MGESSFSVGLKLSGIDDFIGPSQTCIKPEIISRSSNKKAKIQVREDGTYLEIGSDGNSQVLETAKISLNDCLACSGCVTSAESVLVTAQSTKEFMDNVKSTKKTVVISLSPQSRASIAAYYKMNLVQTHKRLVTLFKNLGAHYVFDTSFSREFSLLESAAEFVARKKKTITDPLPMLASACPGWVCYAEKTHGEYILPYISSVKSPQQIMGTIVKYHFAKQINTAPDQIYHVTVMPCYDKKLEASRDDFLNDVYKTRDVDLVLTSGEILDLIHQQNVPFNEFEESPLETLFTNISEDGQFYGPSGGSGGYLEYIFKYVAKELYGISVDKVEYQVTKAGNDFKTATLELDGKPVLTFATCYGFKHIQNLVRKIKTHKCSYDFVEIMACPSGCLNGGGQIKPEKGQNAKELLKKVEDAYNEQKESSPPDNEAAMKLYEAWLDGPFSPNSLTSLHTQYHMREKITNPLNIKW